jgi:ribosomal protein S18 acetylase RimI-like enzyme
MRITIESIRDDEQRRAAAEVRKTVFNEELGIQLPPVDEGRKLFELIARAEPEGVVVATVTAVNTSGEETLHASYGLAFERGEQAARYTQLAVLKEHRGRRIPLQLLREATRLATAAGIRYLWLLFDAERAARSSFCEFLGFRPGRKIVATTYGASRALLLDLARASFPAGARKRAQAAAANGSGSYFGQRYEAAPLLAAESGRLAAPVLF